MSQSQPEALSDFEELTRQYRTFAEVEMRAHGSPIYAAICAGLADDPETGQLTLLARPGNRTPLILLAAVHHLMLSGVAHRLGGYYPTVAGDDARPIDDGLYPAFADFVARHRAAIESLVSTRTTQTNEARRTVITLPALGLVAEESATPLALLEAGASAGLNLPMERYGYSIGGVHTGDPASPVQIECESRGELRAPVPRPVPAVAWRAGLDINPLDVRDPDTIAWLRALIWPEHRDRLEILDAAVAIARGDPPRVVRGDLVDDLPALGEEAPQDAAFTVVHTWVLAYVNATRRLAFIAGLRSLAERRHRSIWLVSCESPRILDSLSLGLLDGAPAGANEGGYSGLALCRFDPDGGDSRRLLAVCHAHGRWIEWLDRGSAGSGVEARGRA